MVVRRLWNGGNAGAKLFAGRSVSVWLQCDRPLCAPRRLSLAGGVWLEGSEGKKMTLPGESPTRQGQKERRQSGRKQAT